MLCLAASSGGLSHHSLLPDAEVIAVVSELIAELPGLQVSIKSQ